MNIQMPSTSGAAPANPMYRPAVAGPKQKPTTPPAEYTDTLGNVYRWNPGGFGGSSPGTMHLTQGEWSQIGNVNQNRGGGTGTGPGGDEMGWLADWKKYLPDPVPREPNLPRVTPGPEADRTGADNATLALAKQRIGRTTSGALKALSRNMQSRGISGSGLESRGASRIIRGGAGDVGNVVNNLAIDALHRADAVNDRNYSGDITQRGADQNFGLSQRGQDVNFALDRARLIPALLQLVARNGGVAY